MIDTETLSTKADAAIISLAAVSFNSKGLHETIDMTVDPDPSASIDFETVKWHTENLQISSFTANLPEIEACHALKNFIEAFREKTPIWACGASFDFPIIKSMFARQNVKAPWQFRDERCFRTMKSLYDVAFEKKPTEHTALGDAKQQAYHLIRILNSTNADW